MCTEDTYIDQEGSDQCHLGDLPKNGILPMGISLWALTLEDMANLCQHSAHMTLGIFLSYLIIQDSRFQTAFSPIKYLCPYP